MPNEEDKGLRWVIARPDGGLVYLDNTYECGPEQPALLVYTSQEKAQEQIDLEAANSNRQPEEVGRPFRHDREATYSSWRAISSGSRSFMSMLPTLPEVMARFPSTGTEFLTTLRSSRGNSPSGATKRFHLTIRLLWHGLPTVPPARPKVSLLAALAARLTADPSAGCRETPSP